MDEDDEEEFCLSIPETIDTNDDSSSSDESDIEVTSTIDEQESELIRISTHLCLNSDDSDDDDDEDLQDDSTMHSQSKVQTSDGDDNNGAGLTMNSSSSIACSLPMGNAATPSQKRKRRAWSVAEKLQAIEHYEKFRSKHSTAKTIGCTRCQLADWLKAKEELKSLQSLNKDGKRKRLKSGGKNTIF